jgi:ribonuclease P/MRP protein subunit POP1
MASNASGKRKQPAEPTYGPNPKRVVKRVKTTIARTILAQASDKALNRNGDLDVSTFVKAREFEIKAMETSMGKSKASLSTRAFQQVPKELRRRTASHNVKRVPKRLRARAKKEVCPEGKPMLLTIYLHT